MQHRHHSSSTLSPTRKMIRIGSLFLLTLLAVVAVTQLSPIAQSAHYHVFADQRSWWGFPNLLNVISNVGFVWCGLAGLRFLRQYGDRQFAKTPWCLFFVGAVLTGIGSAYYHYAPDNARLVWDRLPMTLVFMSLLAAIIAERISVKGGQVLLLPLLFLGSGSVWYWAYTEQTGQGDLRWYGLVQFYPVLLIPVILLLFPARYTHSHYLFGMIGIYGLAKVCEYFDAELLALGHLVSGHTMKHLIAALPLWCVLCKCCVCASHRKRSKAANLKALPRRATMPHRFDDTRSINSLSNFSCEFAFWVVVVPAMRL